MRKIFTLISFAFAAYSAMADDTFVFCYEDGTVIPDGSTIKAVVTDPNVINEAFGMIESGVYVKNTKETNEVASLSFNITTLSEYSSLMVCLGTSCRNYETIGSNAISGVTLNGNSINDLMTHWSAPTEDWETFLPGSCSVTMTIQHGSAPATDCSTITINFAYGEDASIVNINETEAKVIACYSLTGDKVDANKKGIVIQKLSNGTTRKVVNK